MTGLLLIAIAAVWLIVAIAITVLVAFLFKPTFLKIAAGAAVFPVILALPLADEVIGKHQFEALCKQYSVQQIDEQRAMNRRVISMPRGADRFAEGTAVRIRIDPWIYKDAETNEVLVSYHTLHASGGWLIRALGISETSAPLLFNSGCGPKDEDAFKRKLNITVIN